MTVKFLEWFNFKWNIFFIVEYDNFWIMIIGENDMKILGVMQFQVTILFMTKYDSFLWTRLSVKIMECDVIFFNHIDNSKF